jgi:copper chaperone CopZ
MKMNWMWKTAMLSTAALVLCATGVLADTKVTVGVGHMCCGSCRAAAKAALTKVSSDVAIVDKDVTVTLKSSETDIVPVLDALRKGGFPANRIDAGGGPVTIGVAHLCCGGCVNGLKKAMADAKLDNLDTDSLKIADGTMTVKAKDGKMLDLAPVLAAMEKGGFSASKITLGGSVAARPKSSTQRVARR